ncbi:DUF2924 domain-containing protein [Halocynthiibacter sp. C4]|uniref:DUF2924 domain-containing protein n=1 Tax=Halocynthiibacter sp. C4 TaxID=2992758 RepID=UPI00237BE716|nr:DUF2924 domain-containing protein [Halocynthiibacter sp. C4]MDE0589076.1 DUF2924 domain-containing protein [Halocynthiibacter sp. C4]
MSLPTLSELETLERSALCAAWKEAFGQSPPPRMSQPFMRRVLAFEVQARSDGGLSKATLKALSKPNVVAPKVKSGPGLKSGGRLLREWNGITHVVDVTDDGFIWKGETYRSLTAIARAITGTHWSGPRFFGLNSGAAQ